MKPFFYFLFMCIALTSCANTPVIETPPLEQTTLEGGEIPVDFNTETFHVDNLDCIEHNLDLSSETCNVLAWQSYIASLLFMTESERQHHLSVITDDEVGQLQQMLLLTHTNEVLEVRKFNSAKLDLLVSSYPYPLDQLILTYVTLNQSLINLSEQLTTTEQNQSDIEAELQSVKSALKQAQKKIDAITNIEQQLNSEGPLIDDTNN